jgi:hypothetical protein
MDEEIRQAAEEALAVQDAVNLSGIVHSWSRRLSRLHEKSEAWAKMGTDERNKHPINMLWADKVASLTGTQALGLTRVMDAYGECKRLAHLK